MIYFLLLDQEYLQEFGFIIVKFGLLLLNVPNFSFFQYLVSRGIQFANKSSHTREMERIAKRRCAIIG